MLRTFPRRASEIAGGTSPRALTESEEQGSSKPKTSSKHKAISSKPKVAFKSQTWSTGNSTSKPRATSTQKPRRTMVGKRATSDPAAATAPVSKQQSRFASLFISLLAVSPMAIEYEAADQKTMESAQKQSTAPTAPIPPKKAYVRPVSGVKPSEIRKTRWKRFKYEMGLKIKRRNNGKGKDRKKFAQIDDADDVELEELSGQQRTKGDDMT